MHGRSTEEVRKNQEEFQLGVLDMQMEQEASLLAEDTVFLDRAIPDALAYYYFLDLPLNQKLTDALQLYRYKGIFILDFLPLVQDYARREDKKSQKKIHNLLIEVYTSLDTPVVNVPVLPPDDRVDYILSNL